MKDILISIASRHEDKKTKSQDNLTNPEMLDRTFKMLYDTCASKDNFDIQVIICDDQVDMYEPVLKKWKIKPTIIPYNESWLNLFRAQHKQMKKGYYFFMFVPDDMSGLNKSWDAHILAKKKVFDDDLFVLFTQYAGWGRITDIFRKSYPDVANCSKMFEQQPIWTYKFGEFIYHLFEFPFNYTKSREIIIPLILHFLNKGDSKYNRHVECDLNYESLLCTQNMTLKEFPDFLRLEKDNYNDIKSIVRHIKEYIKNPDK